MFESALRPGGIVLFGEVHGSLEIPAFIAAAAARAAQRGAVALALEIPDELGPAIDDYVATADRAALRATPSAFWAWQDGRGGEGLLVMLDAARTLGAPVTCIDGEWPDAEARDAGMANKLVAAIEARPDATWLVSCGNLHARTDSPRWMGWHVKQRFPTLVSLDVAHDGGEIWCATADRVGILTCVATRRDLRGHDGVYRVGRLSPSRPL